MCHYFILRMYVVYDEMMYVSVGRILLLYIMNYRTNQLLQCINFCIIIPVEVFMIELSSETMVHTHARTRMHVHIIYTHTSNIYI